MKRFILLLIVFITCSLPGCDFVSDKLGFDQPEIKSVSPSNGATNVNTDTVIEVVFSKSMDTVKTNQSFSLSGGSGTIIGTYRWSNNNKTMIFTPRHSLTEYNMYSIVITETAEDTDGNDLSDTYRSTFYINNDLTRPEIISHSPLNDAIGVSNDPDIPEGRVTVTFSEAIDIDTIYSGFSITPSVEASYQWSADHTTVTFIPVYGFKYGTTYTATIDQVICDVNGNSLAEQYVFHFTCGDDFINPEVSSVYQDIAPFTAWDVGTVTSNIEKSGDIVITFNESILPDSVYDAISFSPSAQFYVTTESADTIARIHFTSDLEPETDYTMQVTPSITDIQNNPLLQQYNYRFITNGPSSVRPTVTSIYDNDQGSIWTAGEVEQLAISGTVYPFDLGGLVITFSHSIDPSSISMNIVKSVGSSNNPSIINPYWVDMGYTQYRFFINGMVGGNIYKITIEGGNGGVKDSYGNYMEEDYVQYVQVP